MQSWRGKNEKFANEKRHKQNENETALMMKDRMLELKPFHDFSTLNKLEKSYKLKNAFCFVYKKEL